MKSTKLDLEIAAQVEKPPSTVARHRTTEGMWPDGSTDWVRHYGIMDALGLGRGRDNAVIALQAAAEYGWPTLRLRSVLAELCPVVPPGAKIDPGVMGSSPIFNLVRQLQTTIAMKSAAAEGAVASEVASGAVPEASDKKIIAGSRKRAAEGLADDAIDGVGRVLTAQGSSPEDFVGFAELVTTVATELPTPTGSGAEPLSGNELSEDIHSEVQRLGSGGLSGWSAWIQAASPTELVQAMQMASGIVKAIAGDPGAQLAETAWWGFVGRVAPLCGTERAALEPVIGPLLESVKALPRPAPLAARPPEP